MKAKQVSSLILPLDQYGSIGHVQSIFSDSINVSISSRLIHIASDRLPLSSFGVQLEARFFQEVRARVRLGDLVVCKAQKLVFYSQESPYVIDVFDCPSLCFELECGLLTESELQRFQDILQKYTDFEQIGMDYTEKFQKLIRQMTESQVQKQSFREWCHYLIGRGQGLTPSGDDIVLGYVYGLRILIDDSVLTYLRLELEWIKEQTTKVSYEYLYSISCDTVSELFYQLNQNVLNRQWQEVEQIIYRVTQIGHTSGRDTLFGILLASQHVMNNMRSNNNEK